MAGHCCTPVTVERHASCGLPLWAMLRCAASESPSLAWSARDASPATPASLLSPDSALHGGLHGYAEAAGVTAAPLLVAWQPDKHQLQVIMLYDDVLPDKPAIPCSSLLPKPTQCLLQGGQLQGGQLITGGVGALGSLMASWLAASSGFADRLCLLSRSGRWPAESGAAVETLLMGSGLLSLTRWVHLWRPALSCK